MSNIDWKKIGKMVEKIVEDDALEFNEESLYQLMRRYKPELPFHFGKYISECKECIGVDFIKRRDIIDKIFNDEFNEEAKLEFIGYLLYHFHKIKLCPSKLHKLENYLDENR
jgi:hypothetical protein